MKKQQIKAGVASIIVGFLAPVALLVPSVSAATLTWEGNSSSSMDSGLNWYNGGILVDPSDTAIFPSSALNQQPYNDIFNLTVTKIIFNGAVSGPSSKSYTITGGPIGITSGIDAIMTGSGGDHAVNTDVTLGANSTFKTTGSNTLQIGDTGTTLDLSTYNLTLNANGGTITLAGEIDGSGKIIVSGDNAVNMLAKPATGYTGSTEVTSGVYSVTSTTKGNIVINGGTLKGTSDLLGSITMSAGKIAPGNSPGCLGSTGLTLTGGSYDVEIEGTTVCTQYDSTTVTGAVDLGSATTLNIQRLSSFVPAVNDVFTIITNDGTDAVTGAFSGLANGDITTVDGYSYQINYDAGDGNDVVLLVKGTPSAPYTGAGSVLTNPLMAVFATLSALAVIGGLKFAETRRK